MGGVPGCSVTSGPMYFTYVPHCNQVVIVQRMLPFTTRVERDGAMLVEDIDHVKTCLLSCV